MIGRIKHWLSSSRNEKDAAVRNIEELDRKQRDVRHELRNLRARADYIRMLFERMRADQWAGESNDHP